jgi:N-formylglutamate amidohydrolase
MLQQFLIIAALLLAREVSAQDRNDPLRLVTLWAGTLPIILSAPHGGREPISGIPVRMGRGVAQFTTERDSNTAELAEQLAITLGSKMGARPFLIVARFERKYIDANRAPGDAYEDLHARPYYEAYHRSLDEACSAVRNRWGRGLLIDLHGQSVEKETIFRGTANGKSVADLERRFGREAITGGKSVLGQLALKGYKIAPDFASDTERRYTGGYTIRNYGSHHGTGIDAMQLELGTTLRERRNLERTANDFAEAIAVFARHYLPPGDRSTMIRSGTLNSAGVVE